MSEHKKPTPPQPVQRPHKTNDGTFNRQIPGIGNRTTVSEKVPIPPPPKQPIQKK